MSGIKVQCCKCWRTVFMARIGAISLPCRLLHELRDKCECYLYNENCSFGQDIAIDDSKLKRFSSDFYKTKTVLGLRFVDTQRSNEIGTFHHLVQTKSRRVSSLLRFSFQRCNASATPSCDNQCTFASFILRVAHQERAEFLTVQLFEHRCYHKT